MFYIIDHLGIGISTQNAVVVFLITLAMCVPIIYIINRYIPFVSGKTNVSK